MNELKEQIKTLLSRAMNADDKADEKEVENESVDKRKLIDEVAGILKSAGCDDEVIRTAIGKMEKIGYNKSEAENKKAKNADEEEKEEKFEEEKEIAENKKAKNEDEDEEEKEDKAENKCKNSMDDVKKAVFGGTSEKQIAYIPHSKRLEMGNNY